MELNILECKSIHFHYECIFLCYLNIIIERFNFHLMMKDFISFFLPERTYTLFSIIIYFLITSLKNFGQKTLCVLCHLLKTPLQLYFLFSPCFSSIPFPSPSPHPKWCHFEHYTTFPPIIFITFRSFHQIFTSIFNSSISFPTHFYVL